MHQLLQLPAGFTEDLVEFRRRTERFQRGEISEAEYRAFRVPRGVYEQRENGTYMLRARCPAGLLSPEGMRALAQVARRYGNGILHFTTRQDVQVHRVLLDDIVAALEKLYAAGLSTRGGGGNTVRNITGCPHSGVCPCERFDVVPYVVGLTERLLPDPLSYQLPRKYKIAFSACSTDCAAATVQDLGFVALSGNSATFRVYVGGGLGSESHVGRVLEEAIPAAEIACVAEAVKRVFDQHGNRKNRNRARLRFLIHDLGFEHFIELYRQQLDVVRREAPAEFVPRPLPTAPISIVSKAAEAGPQAGLWQQRNVQPQKQADHFVVHIPLVLGDISADTLERLAEIVASYGERHLRTTPSQNLILRWVRRDELNALQRELARLGLAAPEPQVVRNLVACTGAATCRLGICLSRGLAAAIVERLRADFPDPDGLGDVKIHISGCPNSCGRHALADIGLFGAARRVEGRLVPYYTVVLGGRVAEGQSRLAQSTVAVPAHNVPPLLSKLLGRFQASSERPDFARFFDTHQEELLHLVQEHQAIPAGEIKEYCYDWGSCELFSLAGRGPGECGAGVFDLIEVDLQSARSALDRGELREATLLAARALLVTRGEQARDERHALELFAQHFLAAGLVPLKFQGLLEAARDALELGEAAVVLELQTVSQFVAAVQSLYANMDASLRFKPAESAASVVPPPYPAVPATSTPPNREADFRGIVCPLNYVKTKLVLEQMSSGQVLAVLLDEQGSRNVVPSVEKDGHVVLAIEQEQDHWRVVVLKR